MVQSLWKAVWRHLKKLKMDLPYDPEIPLLGIYLKTPKIIIPKNVYAPLCLLQHYLQSPKYGISPCPSVDKWKKQLWYIYTMKYY